jgi:hypothetical protein
MLFREKPSSFEEIKTRNYGILLQWKGLPLVERSLAHAGHLFTHYYAALLLKTCSPL